MIPRYYYKQLWHDSRECCQYTRFYLNKGNNEDWYELIRKMDEKPSEH